MELGKLKKNLETGSSPLGFKEEKQILWFDEITIKDIPLVGGKNASLGEMYISLKKKGVKVPYGFAVTANAYRIFLNQSGAKEKIEDELKNLNIANLDELQRCGRKIRNLIMDAHFPFELENLISKAYKKLEKMYGNFVDVAVRSSATAEDLPDASFAGQQETYLNVHTQAQLLHSCKQCFASLFTDRAISYRTSRKFSHFDVALSIGVQKMVRSDKSCSGVMFSIDTESGFDKIVCVTGSYGLGESVVQGTVNPDEFIVFKPTLNEGYKPIISRKLGKKQTLIIYDKKGSKLTKQIETPKEMQEKFILNDSDILVLAKWAVIIENHYSEKKGKYQPMDMEWAKDGNSNELFIVQARPETVQARRDKSKIENYHLKEKGEVLVSGVAVGSKITHGTVKVLKNIENAKSFKKGDILVTDMTDPDWEPIMKLASGIITNRGGRTCHAAIISREMGVPAVVGSSNATAVLKTGDKITLSCAQGETGFVYKNFLHYQISQTNIKHVPQTKTKLALNIGDPGLAFTQSFLPNDGVGLAREEFIINSHIRIHPNALLNFETLKKNPKAKKDCKEIEELTKGYKNKVSYYVEKLTEGIGTIASAFYPKKVILRMSDFKTNEYSNLIGGEFFEPKEDNPMIGFRGASRYYSQDFKEAFKLECVAIKKVREEFGLKNLNIMIPFCRDITEAKKVLKILESEGLKRQKGKFEVYLMCEIPSNIILADEFLELIDGYSIGTNDLTQLVLGVDRDSEKLQHIYDEKNNAVKDMVAHIIAKCKEKGKYIGICGQAPSDYPEFAKFLVEKGIETMSLNPDSIVKTKIQIAKLESELSKKKINFDPGFVLKDRGENKKVVKKNLRKVVGRK